MTTHRYRAQLERLLRPVDVHFNGDRPVDIQVHDDRLYARVIAEGSLGAGESYMDGWWDCDQLDEMIRRVLLARVDRSLGTVWRELPRALMARLVNRQSPRRAFRVGEHHYDIGNDLYERMLGRYLIYSCGYWAEADNLDDAQVAKMDLICRKLGIEPGMRVLDIGCGWGEMAKYIAENHGDEVVGVTISRAQAEYARELCKGLPVDIRLQDYRALDEKFDRILSVGMFEHVGYKNYPTYMQTCRRLLAPDGLMLLHTIGNNRATTRTDPWIERYIFPNSMIPSTWQIAAATDGRFIMEDWHNFGVDYDRTLRSWYRNFDARWAEIADYYGERFRRMWRYYLLSCAGSFRARQNQLWQVVLSPQGVRGGYRAPR